MLNVMKKLILPLLLVLSFFVGTAQTTINVPSEFKMYNSFVVTWNFTSGSTYKITITYNNPLKQTVVDELNVGSSNYYWVQVPVDNKNYDITLDRYVSGSLAETKEVTIKTKKIRGDGLGNDLTLGDASLTLDNITDTRVETYSEVGKFASGGTHINTKVKIIITSLDFRTEYHREERTPGQNVSTKILSADWPMTKLDDYGLIPNSQYRVVIYGVTTKNIGVINDNYVTYYSEIDTKTFTLGPAVIPSNLSATTTHLTASLHWDLPNQLDYIEGAHVELSSDNISFSSSGFQISYSSNAAMTISDLEPATTYYFRVRTEYGGGQLTNPSTSEAFTTKSKPSVNIDYAPDSTLTDRFTFTVNWPEKQVLIDDPSQLPIRDLTILVDPASENNPTGSILNDDISVSSQEGLTSSKYSVEGLTANTDYQINALAQFNSSYTLNIHNEIITTPAGNPGATVEDETDISDRSFRVNLTNVNPFVEAYYVDVYDDNAFLVIDNQKFTHNSFEVAGLSPQTTYTYDIRLEYPDGSLTSLFGSGQTATTLQALPPEATFIHPVLGAPSQGTPSNIELHWIGSLQDLDYYDVDAEANFAPCEVDTDANGVPDGFQELGMGGVVGVNTSFLHERSNLFDLDVLSYRYYIRSYNSQGNFSEGNPLVFSSCECYGSMTEINDFLASRQILEETDLLSGGRRFKVSDVQFSDKEYFYYYEWETPSNWDITAYEQSSIVVDNSGPSGTNYVTVKIINPCTGVASQTLSLNVNGQFQSITFPGIPDKSINEGSFTLNATASSGLPVTYSSSDPSIASVSGNIVTLHSIGRTFITAYQTGNDDYKAADPFKRPLDVNLGTQDINFQPIADKQYGVGTFSLSYTGGGSGETVVFTSLNENVATISGDQVTVVGIGNVTILADQAGNGNYLAADQESQSFNVTKGQQTITFDPFNPSTISYGSVPLDIIASSSSGLDLNLGSSNTDIAQIIGGQLYILGIGTATITASQNGNSFFDAASDVSHDITITKGDQTIDFSSIDLKTFGDPDFDVAATGGNSENGITFSSDNESVATVSGNTISIVGAGTATITASQLGDDLYNNAIDVDQILTVNKAGQSINFSELSARTFGDADFDLSATSGDSGNPVQFSSSNVQVATIFGTTVTIVGAGETTITAEQDGNANYNDALPVERILTVNKADQSITFETLVGKIFGDPDFSLTGSASSGLDLSYTSSNENVATIAGSTITIVGAGETTITADQAGNTNYNPAFNIQQSLTVEKADQEVTFGELSDKTFGDEDFELSAISTSGLDVTYSSSNEDIAIITGNIISIIGAGTTSIIASQDGNSNYNYSETEQLLTVNKASQTITFSALVDRTFGDTNFELSAISSSGLSVSYSSSDQNVVTMTGTTVSIVGAGTASITASQSGNEDYNIAPDVIQPVTISKADQIITFNEIPDFTLGVDDPITLVAQASSALNVTFTIEGPATIEGSVLTPNSSGTVTVTAAQEGSSNYNPAIDVVRTFDVLDLSKQEQTLSFDEISGKTFGDDEFELVASASSSLSVIFTSSDSEIISIDGNIASINGAGTATITASQQGDDTFNAVSSSQEVTVSKAEQEITFAEISDFILGVDDPITLSATSTSGLEVMYETDGPAELSGAVLTPNSVGLVTVTAKQGGDSNYNSASDVIRSFNVLDGNKQTQLITFEEISLKVFGDGDFQLVAESSSGLDVEFTSSDETVVSILGDIATINGAGTTIITAIQQGNDDFNPSSETQDIIVSKADQTITFGEIPDFVLGVDEAIELSASSNSGLEITYEVSGPVTLEGSKLSPTSLGTVSITALQDGDNNWNAAESVTRIFEVLDQNKQNQTLVFEDIGEKTYGDNDFELVATASSGQDVKFESSDTEVLEINGTVASITGAGTVIITARQEGTGEFNPIETSQELTVAKASQTISFEEISEFNLSTDDPIVLSATATSGLEVSYEISGPAILETNVLTPTEIGIVEVVAKQEGNSNYLQAESVIRSFNVINETLGIDDDFDSQVSIYPNPATKFITIKGVQSDISILTMGGKIAWKGAPIDERIDLTTMEEGIYLVIWTDQKEIKSERLILMDQN